MSAASQEMSAIPAEATLTPAYRAEVQKLDQELLESGHRDIHPKVGKYTTSFALTNYMQKIPNAKVWDVGCRSGSQLYELKRIYGKYGWRYMGVNPTIIPLFEELKAKVQDHTVEEIPVVKGLVEELSKPNITETAERNNIWPPNLVLLLNVLKYPQKFRGEEGVKEAIKSIYDVLTDDGTLLIYEDTGEGLYPKYESVIKQLKKEGLNIDAKQMWGNGLYQKYLEVKKNAPVSE